ncbi:MAG: molybdopterin molybdotransferase MoeA [Chloroflexi bacterium]|nr:molybdopterin molybdotransferase MoeA [Chloroflexota bacterium]
MTSPEVKPLNESKYPMISVAEALEIILSRTEMLAPVALPFQQALGRVLAEDVVARQPFPPFAASAKDGYAVIANDTTAWRRLAGEQTAGRVGTFRVEPGTAARITTGAPLPAGADSVVMIEYTEERDGMVHIARQTGPGDDIRPAGTDIPVDSLVLARGTELGPAEVGLLASLGHTEVRVYPAPRVAVMSTGDEIVEPWEAPGPGQIRDSNRYTLAAAVARAGAEPVLLPIGRDLSTELKERLLRGLNIGDAVLTSGGVSMGKLDLVKPLLEELGQIHFGRVYTKPGKPVTFATVGNKPVFAMPGFPVSSLVSFEIFVRPALRKMQGYTSLHYPRRQVVLSHDIRHGADRTEFQRAYIWQEGETLLARTTGDQGSGRLLSMVGANALLELPHGLGDFHKGQMVQAILIGNLE